MIQQFDDRNKDIKIWINGELLNEPYAYFEPKERLSRQSNNIASDYPVSKFGPVFIPEGKLFAMGDNRYNSADSRYWGFVDSNTVSGKGQMIYWSHDPGANLFSGYKMDRIFDFLK